MRRPTPIDIALGNRLIDLNERVTKHFEARNWIELGLLTGGSELITGHDRLLRSLAFGDEDYEGNALSVLKSLVQSDPRTLPVIENYLDRKFPGESHYISAKPAERKITFAPSVFQVPDGYVEPDLVAVMMPFDSAFAPVIAALRSACETHRLRCLRVDDIWEDSAIIQDVFSLIFRAQIVIVDFTGKNANVMYETGIAHTLGKHVIPVSQSLDDVPFDMRHHRVLKYLPNGEGYAALERELARKLAQSVVPAPPPASPEPEPEEDEIPF